MQPKLSELLLILETETQCYQTMKVVLTDEAQSIGLTGRRRFERIQQEKEALVAKLKRLEGRRRRLVDRLAPADRRPETPLTVSQLARRIDPPGRQQLLDQANRLRQLIGEVQTSNRRNQRLIGHQLDLVNGSLRLLTNLMDSSPVYPKPGTPSPATGPRSGAGRIIRGSV